MYVDSSDTPRSTRLRFSGKLLALACSRELQLVLLLLAGLVLRLYHLDAQSLWLDEGNTWAEVTGRTGKGWLMLLAELFSPDAAYPLYHLLLRGWVGLAGDSEWALRLPSALASTLALGALALAASELQRAASPDTAAVPTLLPTRAALLAPLLLLASPFALWYAQEVKTYSLLLLVTSLQLWALLRALRRDTWADWRLCVGLALLNFFVHRLSLLTTVVVGLMFLLTRPPARRWMQFLLGGAVILLAAVATLGSRIAVGNESTAASGHVAAGPLTALWLTFGRLALDRSPGTLPSLLGLPALDPSLPPGLLHDELVGLFGAARPDLPRLWLLPTAVLFGWGLWRLIGAARQGQRTALALLLSGALPLLLFGISTMLSRLYEPRYMMVVLPAWVLTLAAPKLVRRNAAGETGRRQRSAIPALVGLVLLTQGLALVEPVKGLFSGDPVKEQWREGMQELARRVHPDDLLILHPYYVKPMFDYYAPRVTTDPLPQPVIFPFFGEGFRGTDPSRDQAREFVKREYEPYYRQAAQGKSRALLLIGPEHARTIDPPKTLEELIAETPPGQALPTQADRYGWLGLRFEYPQRTWPCGGEKFVGVHVMCQSYPEAFDTGAPPEPAVRTSATFGGELHLRGYTLKPTRADGAFRPGGGLALTLFWEAVQPPSAQYTMFLHLCDDCTFPPSAGDDEPPLMGYPPAGDTTTWHVGDPLHDERLIRLPADLPAGRYQLLLGVYPRGNPAIEARLPIGGAPDFDQGRMLLTEIDVRDR